MTDEEKDELKRARNRAKKLRFKLRYPEKFKAQKAKHDLTYRTTHKEQKSRTDAEYRAKNVEKLKIKRAEYYKNNKEAFAARSMKWYQDNRKAYLESRKDYRVKNWDKISAAVKEWCATHPERRREHGVRKTARRRAHKMKSRMEPYIRGDIFDRDKGICYLCGEMIDRDLDGRDPMSLSMDHVIPICKGGADAPDNVASTHLVCNQKKHAKLLTILPTAIINKNMNHSEEMRG